MATYEAKIMGVIVPRKIRVEADSREDAAWKIYRRDGGVIKSLRKVSR